MNPLPQSITLAGVVLLACTTPGPDSVVATPGALHHRRTGIFIERS